VRLLKYWCHQMETSGDSLEQFGLACLEVHAVLAEAGRDPLLRSVLGLVELTLALALTRDRAMPGAVYRDQSVKSFIALTAAIEAGQAETASALYVDIRLLDQRQVQ
jgi:DNA-binding FadR family transcriptional regulator